MHRRIGPYRPLSAFTTQEIADILKHLSFVGLSAVFISGCERRTVRAKEIVV